MNTITKQRLTFDQFIENYPDDGKFYELVNGEIVEMRATRNHDDVADFIADSFKEEIKRLNLNYVVKNTAVIKTLTVDKIEQGRKPDVSVINRDVWRANRATYAALDEPIQLAVEVVSTNWEDDYVDKFEEYQSLGILEYWIVYYLAIGGRKYLGKPKFPSVFVYILNQESQYNMTQFRSNEKIVPLTFPELSLTAEEILNA
ncbi:MAG: Uma2 family endonuclease [Okeania sp. SIO2G4]|uniref:Uma2 family endonuclease n=1 Tax=unclassified Okeania TaxID=2634635 RepID=UPI0013B6B8DF|nr:MULTISPECIES: Uma2 family endonuclease [unclassified Okeania]NEP06137.1 Uma2 family endonuclease [Okeania sp. SIO4D6]NEP43337.1 Uma2 family endonuclease [Okeania sp. SIO2H7]NEP72131.1 Uma2 family endonuclease [Okeania sp. SIO2G5]NEP92989.1 Uma2 family endonuclease [Okeania sp. SIO2F5]NEQ91109.1 Uma2 family endonuclease [Okeania sp. SIO2G4]